MSIFKDMSVDEIINYGLSYKGSFPLDILTIKSLIKNKNERKEFDVFIENQKKEFLSYSGLNNNDFVDYLFSTRFIFGIVNNGQKNTISCDYDNFVIHLYYFINSNNKEKLNSFIKSKTINDYISILLRDLKEIKEKLLSVKNQDDLTEIMINYPALHDSCCKEITKKNNVMLNVGNQNTSNTNLNYFQNELLNQMKIFISRAISLVNRYPVANLNDAFDSIESLDREKFAFYVSSTILYSIIPSEDLDRYHNAIYHVINYYLNAKDSVDPKMKIKMDGFIRFGQEEITFKDFEKKLINYIKKHPEIRFEKFDKNFFSEEWSIEEIDEYLTALNEETMEFFDEVDPDRLFLPNGKNQCRVCLDEYFEQIEMPTLKNTKENRENLRIVADKREFYAKNISKIYKPLLGKNKFKGYIANIFDNGYVIFEKYDINIDDVSSKPGAAYIMTINNFNKLCTLTIPEIREIAKKNKNNPSENDSFEFVDYKIHRGNWQEKLQEYVDKETNISLKETPGLLNN